MKPDGGPYASVYADAIYHRKFLRIPETKRLAAFGFWAATLALCQQCRNDGYLPREQLGSLFACRADQREHLIGWLTKVGLFEATEDGIHVHDYLDWNKSREEIAAARKRMAEGGRKSGATRRNKSDSVPNVASEGTFETSTEKSRDKSAEERESRGESTPSAGGFGMPLDDAPEIQW